MSEATLDAEALIREYERIWNDRDFEALSEVVAESFTFSSPTAGTIQGRENCEAYARDVVEGFPDFQVEIHEILVDEPLVATESTLSGTHEGEYDGIPPTGERFEVRDMAMSVVEAGKLQEERLYFDRYDFFEQLGLIEE